MRAARALVALEGRGDRMLRRYFLWALGPGNAFIARYARPAPPPRPPGSLHRAHHFVRKVKV